MCMYNTNTKYSLMYNTCMCNMNSKYSLPYNTLTVIVTINCPYMNSTIVHMVFGHFFEFQGLGFCLGFRFIEVSGLMFRILRF